MLRARNRSNIPMVIVPHPFEPLPKDDIKGLARDKFQEIATALRTGKAPEAKK
ncbi:MAG: hypothetical protein HY261_04345 [Chloroflexi bacterium]|nr:hypothetical protein [Chloroflexota bacterium]